MVLRILLNLNLSADPYLPSTIIAYQDLAVSIGQTHDHHHCDEYRLPANHHSPTSYCPWMWRPLPT